MRIFQSILPLFVLFGEGFTKKVQADQYEDFYRLSQRSTPLKLNDATYASLTAAPRNHSVAILLTALETRFGCQLCQDFQPEWDLLGRSWLKGDKAGESRLLFGTLDFADGRDVFVSVCNKVWIHGLCYSNANATNSITARLANSPGAPTLSTNSRSPCSRFSRACSI